MGQARWLFGREREGRVRPRWTRLSRTHLEAAPGNPAKRLCRKQTKNLVSPEGQPRASLAGGLVLGSGRRRGSFMCFAPSLKPQSSVACPLCHDPGQPHLRTHTCAGPQRSTSLLPTPASQADRCDPRTSTPAHRIVPGAPGMMESPKLWGSRPKSGRDTHWVLGPCDPDCPRKCGATTFEGRGCPTPELPARDSRQPGSLGTGPQGPCCSRVPPRT